MTIVKKATGTCRYYDKVYLTIVQFVVYYIHCQKRLTFKQRTNNNTDVRLNWLVPLGSGTLSVT